MDKWLKIYGTGIPGENTGNGAEETFEKQQWWRIS